MRNEKSGELDAVIARTVKELGQHGFAVIPGFLTGEEVDAGRANLRRYFPTPEEYYDAAPHRYAWLRGSQVAGLVNFPFVDDAINDQVTSPRLVALARAVLDVPEVRLVGAELWAKYAGATDYDQTLHQDFGNNTLVYPREGDGYGRIECFLYYSDVTEDCGATRFLSREHTKDLPLNVAGLARDGDSADAGPPGLTTAIRPDLYDHEVPAVGPAGTLVVYTLATFHRGAALSRPRSHRWIGGAMFRPTGQDWSDHICFPHSAGGSAEMNRFLTRATVEQRSLVGFPAPGDGYWNDLTLAGVAARYPGMDLTPYAEAVGS